MFQMLRCKNQWKITSPQEETVAESIVSSEALILQCRIYTAALKAFNPDYSLQPQLRVDRGELSLKCWIAG